jgi:hypothetical protein
LFEVFVTFAIFGAYLAIFWMHNEIQQLHFSFESFLNEYSIVFFLGLVIVRIRGNVLQATIREM